jgi:P27 family predicted phage terminase small subunit
MGNRDRCLMAGRRPKPTALHKLQGTYNATNHGRDRQFEPIAEGDLLATPKGLTPSQRASWRYAIDHAPRSILKKIDRGMLKVWIEAEDRHNTAMEMQTLLDRDATLKLLIRGPLGLVPSPYNDILDKTAKTMIRVAQDLGFSPAARPRLKTTPEPEAEDEADPWTALRLIPGGVRDGD